METKPRRRRSLLTMILLIAAFSMVFAVFNGVGESVGFVFQGEAVLNRILFKIWSTSFEIVSDFTYMFFLFWIVLDINLIQVMKEKIKSESAQETPEEQ